MAPLTNLSRVDNVRVKVTYQAALDREEVFLLEVHLDAPAPAHEDSSYLSALSPVVELLDSPPGCVVRIGREHRLGDPTLSILDVALSLPMPARQGDETDPADRTQQQQALEAAVATAFRELITSSPSAHPPSLRHDEALSTARARVAELASSAGTTPLPIVAEEHLGEEWGVRLAGGAAGGFEVRIGFVDGHPGTTHITRLHTGEVVDSVGSD